MWIRVQLGGEGLLLEDERELYEDLYDATSSMSCSRGKGKALGKRGT